MGKLIAIRHGQSIWNAENRFTGWVDVDLSEKGVLEAEKSGKLLKDLNLSKASKRFILKNYLQIYSFKIKSYSKLIIYIPKYRNKNIIM